MEGGRLSKEEYNRRHRENGKLVERKKKEERARFKLKEEKAERKARELEVKSRERKNGEVNKEIKMANWTVYFRNLSGGMGGRVRGEGRVRKVEEQETINRGEVDAAIDNFK